MYKDKGCGQISLDNIDQVINVAGWVDSWRDHGSLLFLDLRDSTGTVQVVFDKSVNSDNHEIASSIRNEWVIQIKGIVKKRIEGAENPNIPTGFIEVNANELVILNPSKTPPFEVTEKKDRLYGRGISDDKGPMMIALETISAFIKDPTETE